MVLIVETVGPQPNRRVLPRSLMWDILKKDVCHGVTFVSSVERVVMVSLAMIQICFFAVDGVCFQ